MADPTSKRSPARHSAEVFEEEIEDLEKATVTSWSTWLAGIGAFALLVGIVLAVMAYETHNRRIGGIGNLPSVSLVEPIGTIDHLPAAFRWDAVAGVQSYLLTVQRSNEDEILLRRSTHGTSLAATAEDLAQFGTGAYRWTVEARTEDGKTKAWGEGEFSCAVGSP